MRVTMRPVTKLPKIIIHRKVAAYCRVSTQQEIQHHRLGMQLCCATPEGTRLHLLPAGADRGSAPSSRRRQRSSALHLMVRVPLSRKEREKSHPIRDDFFSFWGG